jgi:hypothetical protein
MPCRARDPITLPAERPALEETSAVPEVAAPRAAVTHLQTLFANVATTTPGTDPSRVPRAGTIDGPQPLRIYLAIAM